MLTVEKMHDDLDYWIHLGLGEDIINMPDQRQEYQHLVKPLTKLGVANDCIAQNVLIELREQISKPRAFRKTTYVLLWLEIKKYFEK